MSKTFSIFVKNNKVKNVFLFFILCLGFSAHAQEFGQHFLTINAETLPSFHIVEKSDFINKSGKVEFTKNLRVNASNYWNPVSMMDALTQQDSYLNRKNTIKKEITAESLGFTLPKPTESTIQFQVGTPNYFDSNRVRNSVYKDVSMPFLYPSYNERRERGHIHPYF